MPTLTPEEVRARFRHTSDTDSHISTWVQVFFLLVLLTAGGVYGYHVWLYRTPQAHDLTLNNGEVLHLQIYACDRDVIKATLSDKTEPFYLPISQLSPESQEFIKHLGTSTFTINTPLTWVYADSAKKAAKIEVVQRTNDTFEYKDMASGEIHIDPISGLSTQDQTFIRRIPTAGPQLDPAALNGIPLVTNTGKALEGRFVGKTEDVVGLMLPDFKLIHYFPFEDLSKESQKTMADVGNNLTFNWPLNCIMYDSTGKAIHVHVTGRISGFAILEDVQNDSQIFRPLSDFSEEDQKVMMYLKRSPPPVFPFNCTLTDNQGRTLVATIQTRTDANIMLKLANGTLSNFPISKLSVPNQQFLATIKAEIDTPEIRRIREHIASLEVQNSRLEAAIADPSTPQPGVEVDKAQLIRNQKEIAASNLSIDAIVKEVETEKSKANGTLGVGN